MIPREIKCSLSAGSRVHVFMSTRSDAHLGSFGWEIQAPEPCIEIVSQLQRIFSYPTGQGAALQTNLPSISLPDWQPGIWLKTKSVNNSRVYKTHILHISLHSLGTVHHLSIWEHVALCAGPSIRCWLVSALLSCDGLTWAHMAAYAHAEAGLNEGAKCLSRLLSWNPVSVRFQSEMHRAGKDGWIQIEGEIGSMKFIL